MKNDILTLDELRSLLSYDESTGAFTRLVRMGRQSAGSVAGSIQKNGYISIVINKKKYLAHRLAWFYVRGEWPLNDVDHRTLVRTDNRFSELRQATRQQNMQNIRKHRDNTSGFKGVSWESRRGVWRATIQINGKWQQLGTFKTAVEAHEAYTKKASDHFGSFARTA